MKRDRKTIQLAKKLLELSRDEAGTLSEPRVKEVLSGLREVKPRRYGAVLRTYLQLVRREIARHTARVSSPGALSEAALDKIESGFSSLYGRPVKAAVETDPTLIAGVRVRVGDDLYDASLAGRLKRLGERVH